MLTRDSAASEPTNPRRLRLERARWTEREAVNLASAIAVVDVLGQK